MSILNLLGFQDKPSPFRHLKQSQFYTVSHIGAGNVAVLPIQLSPRNRLFASHSQLLLGRKKVYWTFLAGDRSRCQSPRTTLHRGRIIEMKGDPRKTAVGAYPLVNVYGLRTGKWPSRNSGLTHEKWWIFPVRYVNVYQAGYIVSPEPILGSFGSPQRCRFIPEPPNKGRQDRDLGPWIYPLVI